jgi:hypothetical protein
VNVSPKKNQRVLDGQLTSIPLHGLQPIEENRLGSGNIILSDKVTDTLAPFHQSVLSADFVASVST